MNNKSVPVTISYPSSKHCPRGSKELREYVNDFAFITKVLQQASVSAAPKASAPSANQVKEIYDYIRPLERKFVFGEAAEDYVVSNPSLGIFLLSAAEQLRKYFGKKAKYRLQVLKEAADSHGKLFVEIYPSVDFEEATAKLNKFDQDWWFKQPGQIHTYLEFCLEFDKDGF
jgi:hypothetical protein